MLINSTFGISPSKHQAVVHVGKVLIDTKNVTCIPQASHKPYTHTHTPPQNPPYNLSTSNHENLRPYIHIPLYNFYFHQENKITYNSKITTHYTTATMKLSLIPVLTFLALASAAAQPQRQVIVSYPDNTPNSVLEAAMDEIRAAGGMITHEYKIFK
jgi:hypothetical protein